MGIHQVEQIAKAVPVEISIRIKRRSVMWTEIPKVEYEKKKQVPAYSFYHTRMSLDEACQQFEKVKELTIHLAAVSYTHLDVYKRQTVSCTGFPVYSQEEHCSLCCHAMRSM